MYDDMCLLLLCIPKQPTHPILYLTISCLPCLTLPCIALPCPSSMRYSYIQAFNQNRPSYVDLASFSFPQPSLSPSSLDFIPSFRSPVHLLLRPPVHHPLSTPSPSTTPSFILPLSLPSPFPLGRLPLLRIGPLGLSLGLDTLPLHRSRPKIISAVMISPTKNTFLRASLYPFSTSPRIASGRAWIIVVAPKLSSNPRSNPLHVPQLFQELRVEHVLSDTDENSAAKQLSEEHERSSQRARRAWAAPSAQRGWVPGTTGPSPHE